MFSYLGSLLTNAFHQNVDEKNESKTENICVDFSEESLKESCDKSYDIIGIQAHENEDEDENEGEITNDNNHLEISDISSEAQNNNLRIFVENENTYHNNRNFKKEYFLNRKKYGYNFTKHNLLAKNRPNEYKHKLRIKCPQGSRQRYMIANS